MINTSNNFCRVFELPEQYPRDFCFSGGIPVVFRMADWFQPVPQEELQKGELKNYEPYLPMLREFLKGKVYVNPGRSYLILMDFGEAYIFNFSEGEKLWATKAIEDLSEPLMEDQL